MNTVRKLSARSNEHFLRVVGQAAQSTRQAEIARSVGLSETTISRLLRTQEAREAVDVLRAQALAKSWEAFSELLNEALQYLHGAMRNPLVGHPVRTKIALKMLELGMLAGALPDESEGLPGLTINLPPAAYSGGERRDASGDTDTDAGNVFPAALNTDNDAVGSSEAHSVTKYEMPKDLGEVFTTGTLEVHDEDDDKPKTKP